MNQIAIMESKIEVLGKQVDDRDMELSAIYKAILARLEELDNAKITRSVAIGCNAWLSDFLNIFGDNIE
jgi:SMC interacting uncharacterized protein involved in chromosome segregation